MKVSLKKYSWEAYRYVYNYVYCQDMDYLWTYDKYGHPNFSNSQVDDLACRNDLRTFHYLLTQGKI